MNREDATLLILLIGFASGMFAGFCPSWFTVSSPFFHEQSAKEENIKRIRWGEAAATVTVLTVAVAVSSGERSKLPIVIAIGVCAVFIGGYEYMIAHPAKGA